MSPDDIISTSTFPLITQTHTPFILSLTKAKRCMWHPLPCPFYVCPQFIFPSLSCPKFLFCSPSSSLPLLVTPFIWNPQVIPLRILLSFHSLRMVLFFSVLPTVQSLYPHPLPLFSAAVQLNFVSLRWVFWMFSWSDTEGLFTTLPVFSLFHHLARRQMHI